jgi:hypothetical protein
MVQRDISFGEAQLKIVDLGHYINHELVPSVGIHYYLVADLGYRVIFYVPQTQAIDPIIYMAACSTIHTSIFTDYVSPYKVNLLNARDLWRYFITMGLTPDSKLR